jgi:hypothetical protein
MPARIIRVLQALELEEQILNGAALVGLVGVFLPWINGEWLGGERVTYSGFGFYTSFLGTAVSLLQVFILLVTFLPLFGGPVLLRKRYRETVRMMCALLSTVLVLAALSVLMNVTFEFSRMEVVWGIYVALVGNFVALLYSFLRWQEQRKSQVLELFHHPEDQTPLHEEKDVIITPPSPPPPPAPDPEEHRLYP